MLLFMVVLFILLLRSGSEMVLKALDMSRVAAIVRIGGFRLVKPAVIVLVIVERAVVVECCLRNSCSCGWMLMCEMMCCSRRRSSVFAIGLRREIGL